MNVKELIKYLEKFPQDMSVMVRGYEGGFSDLDDGEVKLIQRDVHTESYYGTHGYPSESGGDKEKALIL